jgi:uncharacterized membrane protein
MSRARYIAQAGVIAAVYATLTLIAMQFLGALAWGPIQLRVSEAFTVIALVTPAAVPGLTIGSVVANALNPTAVWPLAGLDVVFGSLGTLLGALWMRRFRNNLPLALAGPVITNALIVPAYLPVLLKGIGFYTLPWVGANLEGAWFSMYLFGVVTVGIGEGIVLYAVGWPLALVMKRMRIADVSDSKG